jgi:hypothetical protein
MKKLALSLLFIGTSLTIFGQSVEKIKEKNEKVNGCFNGKFKNRFKEY